MGGLPAARVIFCWIALKLPIEVAIWAGAECVQSHHSEWLERGEASMCKLCDQGMLNNHFGSRRNFLKGAAAAGVAAAGLHLFASRPAAAQAVAQATNPVADMPQNTGRPARRYVICGGSVMSMDPRVGDFAEADVLVEGKTILAVRPNLAAGTADVIDARGRIVMPGFIDTHHHQFETALRSFLADGVLINDGSGTPSGSTTYFEFILNKFAPVYRPQDVYINELFGALSQLDDGVTTVHDVSQIHHTPQHSDAAIQALFDSGRRSPPLAISRAREATPRTMPIRRTRSASTSGSSPRATSSSP